MPHPIPKSGRVAGFRLIREGLTGLILFALLALAASARETLPLNDHWCFNNGNTTIGGGSLETPNSYLDNSFNALYTYESSKNIFVMVTPTHNGQYGLDTDYGGTIAATSGGGLHDLYIHRLRQA